MTTNWTKIPKLKEPYKYDIAKLVQQVCSDPMELGDLIAKISLYVRETTNANNFTLKPDIDNPFKKGETIHAILGFKTSTQVSPSEKSDNRD